MVNNSVLAGTGCVYAGKVYETECEWYHVIVWIEMYYLRKPIIS
jgi:hypothetical protein